MGFVVFKVFLENPRVECIALCDIDENVLNSHAADVEKISGKKLVWDGAKFTNDEEVNKYLIPVYREPWKLPVI